MTSPRMTVCALACTALTCGALALLAGPAAADTDIGGHCVLTTGVASFSPALDITSSPTTETISATGSGCVDLSVGNASGTPVALSSIDISGAFTGTGSTLLSNYSGTGSITFHLAGGGTVVDTYSASCISGVLAVCPFLGTITSSTGDHAGDAVELTPQTLALNPLGTYASIGYTELASTWFDDVIQVVGAVETRLIPLIRGDS